MRIETIINTMENRYCRLFNGEHIFDMHTELEDKELIRRVSVAKHESRPIYGATVFTISEEKIISYIKKILLLRKDMVERWLEDEDDNLLVITGRFKKPIGHGYFNRKWHDWKTGAADCEMMRVVLKADRNDRYFPFKVVTAYATTLDKSADS